MRKWQTGTGALSASLAIGLSGGAAWLRSRQEDAPITVVGARQHYGNDGPLIGFQHYVDRCLTFVSQAHQTFTPADMTGTLNGEPVHSYQDGGVAAGIFNNNYTFITVPHHGCE